MLTPESKKRLAATIRWLREALRKDLREEAERVYRLSVPLDKARLAEAPRVRRARLDAWLDERIRAAGARSAKDQDRARSRFLDESVEGVAATVLNRLVVVRVLEASGLLRPAVLTRGVDSPAARELREFAPDLFTDENEGYAWLLGRVFDELSIDLPGLFGEVGLSALLPVPPSTLREVTASLDDPELAEVWEDDTVLGWIYQYWNDPRREELDKKINDGGKIEGHEIAAKTQMFTERYMVEWLLQNSLGLQWLAMCRKNGWTAEAEAPGPHGEPSVLDRLEARRVDWRAKREKGEVALDALMPYSVGELEERWRYYVPQEIPADLVAAVPSALRSLKILDPACGSGHFLVIAFGLLAALYEEESRHRGVSYAPADIARWILEENLHGVDLDPRAVQIAAAALHLAARRYAGPVAVQRMNLVATAFDLARLGPEDEAVRALQHELERDAGIAPSATAKIIRALGGIDAFGSLVKLDKALEEAIAETERSRGGAGLQGVLFGEGGPSVPARTEPPRSMVERIERFLAERTRADDLGVRLDGAQLAAGVRFARMVREGQYDLVVGNPPYQGTARMADAAYVAKHYPKGKADLYAAFLQRGLELAKAGGVSAMVTMRGWMFLGQYEELRRWILAEKNLRSIGDFDRGAFDDVPNEVLAVSLPVVVNKGATGEASVGMMPTPLSDKSYDRARTNRKRAAVLTHVGSYEFKVSSFDVIEGRPIVYWWSTSFLRQYALAPKLGDGSPAKAGAVTGNHTRFLRAGWEVAVPSFALVRKSDDAEIQVSSGWVRYVKGARGMCWVDPCDEVCNWRWNGLETKSLAEHLYGSYTRQIRNEDLYFSHGIGVAGIGSSFSARVFRWRSVFDNMAASVFPEDRSGTLCVMNSALSRSVVQSLNPGLHFEISDVNRLPLFPVESADEIFATIERAFSEHEAARENSVEFRRPGPSPWRYAQDWAQRAVDRPTGEPLPPWEPVYDPTPPVAEVSYALGVALGRFGAAGEGILTEPPKDALPAGILFLSGAREKDGLTHPACAPLRAAWDTHGPAIAPETDLRTWLRREFFAHHKDVYENRPIWWPLSSSKKTFVAWVAIHRWGSDTLPVLLADHLLPEQRALEGELTDLRAARAQGDKSARARAERRFAEVQKVLKELEDFIDAVKECATRGAPPVDATCPKRERDAAYAMDLDDGVMVNSSALWPLLEAQWKDPRKWWKELCTAEGRKDYDWSHLAQRYFPTRVAAKCEEDPSLAVAHGCFWRLHPAKAYAWELRLQDELRPDFRIDEGDAGEHRERFLRERAAEARAIEEKERRRREKKSARKGSEEEGGPQGELGLGEGAAEG